MASNTVKLRFLTASQVIRLHNTLIMSAQPTQPAMQESAVQSPLSIMHYTGQQDVFQLAASLSEKIMKNHAFQDGNKRTTLVAADMFLKINGYRLNAAAASQPDESPTRTLEDAQVAACTNVWIVEQLGQFYQRMATADGGVGQFTPEIVM